MKYSPDSPSPSTSEDRNNPSEERPPQETPLSVFQNTVSNFWLRIRGSGSTDSISQTDPVIILGKTYDGDLKSPETANAIQSKLWFSYRTGFEPIERAEDGPAPLSFLASMMAHTGSYAHFSDLFNSKSFCSDVGWGCMIRTSQCLLANTLLSVVLVENNEASTPLDLSSLDKQILSLFADNYSAPFSLHNFIRVASELPLAVKPGQWFGPSAASLSIMRLCNNANKSEGKYPCLKVLISENGDLQDEDIRALLVHDSSPVLILFPIRLGIEKINVLYYPSLFQLLDIKQAMGIAGGKPSSSYYFFGYKGSLLLYLDPHNVQSATSDINSYKTLNCLILPVSELDPSMVVGCLIRNLDDYDDFKNLLASSNKIIHFHTKLQSNSHIRPVPNHNNDISREPTGSTGRGTSEDDFVDLGDELDTTLENQVNSIHDGSDDDTSSPNGMNISGVRTDSIFGKCEIIDRPAEVTVLEDE